MTKNLSARLNPPFILRLRKGREGRTSIKKLEKRLMDFDQWNEALSKGTFDQTENSDKNPDRFIDFFEDDFEEEETSSKGPMKY